MSRIESRFLRLPIKSKMFVHSLVALYCFSLLMTATHGQQSSEPPVLVNPSLANETTSGSGGFCSFNDSQMVAIVRKSFMVGPDLYITDENHIYRLPTDPIQEIQNISQLDVFPKSERLISITQGILFQFECGGSSVDSSGNSTDGSSASVSTPAAMGPVRIPAKNLTECEKADNIFLLFGKDESDKDLSYAIYKYYPSSREFVIVNMTSLPWGLPANTQRYEVLTKALQMDPNPDFYSGFFDKNQRRLYIFGTVSTTDKTPAIFYKQFFANGTFDPEPGMKRVPFANFSEIIEGAMMINGKVYVMFNNTNKFLKAGVHFQELVIDETEAKIGENSFPLKTFVNCDNNSPLKPEETDAPLTDRPTEKVNTTPKPKPGLSWIIWLILALILIAIVIALIYFCCMGKKSEEKVEPKPEDAVPPVEEAKPQSPGDLPASRSGSDSGSAKKTASSSGSTPASSTGVPSTGSKALAKPSGGTATDSTAGSKKSGTDSKALARKSSNSSVRSSLSTNKEPSTLRSQLTSKTSSKK